MHERSGWVLAGITCCGIVAAIMLLSWFLGTYGEFDAPSLAILSARSAENPGRSSTFVLKPVGNSGEYGQVVVAEIGEKRSRIILHVDGVPKGEAQAASLHFGRCPRVGDKQVSLAPVLRGHSETFVDISYTDLVERMPYALSVSRYSDNPSPAACGELRPITPLSKRLTQVR